MAEELRPPGYGPHDPYKVEKRKALTPKQRAKLFIDRKGICCWCGGKIKVGEPWIDEHWNPLWRNGDNADSNRGVAHTHCAKEKTKQEATARAKGRRVAAKHMGAWQSKGKPMPGTKRSGWKKKLNGQVERR